MDEQRIIDEARETIDDANFWMNIVDWLGDPQSSVDALETSERLTTREVYDSFNEAVDSARNSITRAIGMGISLNRILPESYREMGELIRVRFPMMSNNHGDFVRAYEAFRNQEFGDNVNELIINAFDGITAQDLDIPVVEYYTRRRQRTAVEPDIPEPEIVVPLTAANLGRGIPPRLIVRHPRGRLSLAQITNMFPGGDGAM